MTPAKMERLVTIDGDQASLDRIARPDTALAIWWRRLSEPLRAGLETLDLTAVDNVSIEIDADRSVDAALRHAGYSAVLAPLSADVDLLIRRHAALTGEDRLSIRLEVMDSDVGSTFDADDGAFRMLCTYIGPGTQWCCVGGQDAICEVPTGAVGVFKGRKLLNPPTVLQRTPPFGGRRLVLVIDPAQQR